MSDIILDSQQYFHDYSDNNKVDGKLVYPNNYKGSDIRAWLNGTFLETAFNELAKKSITETIVDNSEETTAAASDNMYACENTNDKIFLLSYADLSKGEYGLTIPTARALTGTAYSRIQGLSVNQLGTDYIGYSGWLLRSPSSYDYYYVSYLKADGTIDKLRAYATSAGVVPALYIKFAIF